MLKRNNLFRLMGFDDELVDVLRIIIHVNLFSVIFLFACVPVISGNIFAKTIPYIANKLNLIFERIEGGNLLLVFACFFD
jgi:hypothetical protein